MQIVIDIPDRLYKNMLQIKNGSIEANQILNCAKSGIALPTNHGRLIDADALNRRDVNCANVPMNFINTAPTIIEANRESEDK